MKTKELILESLLIQIQTELEDCDECKVDVPYWMAVLNQNLINYDELLESLEECDMFDVSFELTDEEYTFGVISIYRLFGDIVNFDLENDNTVHKIRLTYAERYWGYCECNPEDEGYDLRHNCCGNGCDWVAPVFEIYTEYNMGRSEFNGVQHDIWDLEDKYNNIDLVKKKELEESAELSRLLREKEYLETRIKELTK
ncbi:MAG: hypothetical protein ACRCTZ_07775 [Sarcina sp.]